MKAGNLQPLPGLSIGGHFEGVLMLGNSGIWYAITEDAASDLRAAEAKAYEAKRRSGPLTVKKNCIVSAIGFVPISTLTAWSRELMDGWQHPSVTAPKVGIPIYDFEGQMRLHKESENLERVQLEKRIEFARLDAQAEYYESKRATDNALARVTEKSRVAQSAPADTATPDLSQLANPSQLIAAFGSFTGMDASWFAKWADYPALRDALKVKGTSGRGRTTDPLFCPFKVMQGLMKNPRKGSNRRPFHSAEKPWELLKRHFPSVYATYQGQSPLDD